MELFDFDPEKLKQEAADTENSKMWLNVANSAANNLLSAPSAAEIQLGQKRGPMNVGLDKVAAGMSDPWEKQKKTYEAYKAAKDGQALESDTDENSREALAMRQVLVSKFGADPEQVKGLTKKQMTSVFGDPQKMAEIQAQKVADFENKMAEMEASQKFQSGEKAKDRAAELAKERLKVDADNKNLPQNVYQAATYGKRLEDANKQMDQIMTKYDPTAVTQGGVNGMLPDMFKPENAKLLEQSQRNFVNAVLRRESGSAISPSEFESANKQYFPQIGDSAEVIKQKKRNRDVALAGLKTEGAKAWNKMEGNLSQATAAHQEAPSINKAAAKPGKPKRVIQNGHEYILNEKTGEYE